MSWKKFAGTIAGAVAAPFTGGLSLVAGAGYDYLKSQKEALNKQNQLNQQQAQLQNQLAMENWDLANIYNSPKEQMARLQQAGLNPNLVYGSGNVVGNTAGVPDASAVGSQTAFNQADTLVKTLPILQGFANLRNTNTQNALLQYQMGQTQAQTDNLIAQNSNIGVQNEIMQHNLKIARETGQPVGDQSTVWTVAGQELSKLRNNPGELVRRLIPGASLAQNLSNKIVSFFKK